MPADYLKQLFGFDGQTVVVIGGTGALGGTLCDGLAQAGRMSLSRGEARARQ